MAGGKIIFQKGGKSYGSMEIKDCDESSAKIYLYGDICGSQWDKWTNDDMCPQDIADMLNGIPPNSDVELHINSGGGSVHGALAIYSQLSKHSGRKVAYIDGLAASAASFIPFACDEVHIMSAAQFMIHKPWSRVMGDADDMQKEAKVLDLCQSSITDIYMLKAVDGVTREQITEMINSETWLKGSEVSQYFNIVVDEIGEVAACTSELFGCYKNTPEELKKLSPKNSKANKNDTEAEALKLQMELLSL